MIRIAIIVHHDLDYVSHNNGECMTNALRTTLYHNAPSNCWVLCRVSCSSGSSSWCTNMTRFYFHFIHIDKLNPIDTTCGNVDLFYLFSLRQLDQFSFSAVASIQLNCGRPLY